MAKKTTDSIISNRRARHDYELHDQFSVGIVLTGAEVKAARGSNVSLKGSYVTLKDNELWLINASFSVLHSRPGMSERTVETGARKLLAKKREIEAMKEAKNQGLTIVPLSMTTRTRFIKVTIATARGKKMYDKRETIKRRDQEREQKRLIANRS